MHFISEEQAYGDGVKREWLGLLAAQLFDRAYGLFRRCEGAPSLLYPATSSAVQEDYLQYFEFAGRVAGKWELAGGGWGETCGGGRWVGEEEKGRAGLDRGGRWGGVMRGGGGGGESYMCVCKGQFVGGNLKY